MAKNAKTLNDFFEDTLKDIFYAEKKILKALPKMAKAAHSEELRRAFENILKRPKVRYLELRKYLNLPMSRREGKRATLSKAYWGKAPRS